MRFMVDGSIQWRWECMIKTLAPQGLFEWPELWNYSFAAWISIGEQFLGQLRCHVVLM